MQASPTLISPSSPDAATTFARVLSSRRAVRDFSTRPLDRALLDALLTAAGTAPSSLGVQPFEMHLVITEGERAALARACNGQRAARSAQALVAFVVGPSITRRRVEESRAYYATAPIPQRSREYHQAGLTKLARSLTPLVLPLLGVARSFVTALFPSRGALPLGAQGARDWAARSAMLAAQTLLLAATAHGVDSCPMEGFDGGEAARVLGLPRDAAPVLVVALGYRAEDARLEPQWRRALEQLVVTR
ncbi:MAG: nitroreductase family protein [Byssovorax sp.]